MKTELISTGSDEILSLEDVKNHLRIGIGQTDDDDHLNALIPAVRSHVEEYTGRKLRPETWKIYYDAFPSSNSYDSFDIPYAPLRSIPSTGVVYTLSSGGSTTFSSSKWASDTVSQPGRLVLDYSYEWPSETLHNRNPIAIESNVGYSASSDIPKQLIHAMKILMSQLYEQREPVVLGTVVRKMPYSAGMLMKPFKLWTF